MPTIALFEYFRFYAYTFDIIGTEPKHLHIVKGKSGKAIEAKIWLDTGEFADTGNLTAKEQTLIQKVVSANKSTLLAQIEIARAGGKVKRITLKLK